MFETGEAPSRLPLENLSVLVTRPLDQAASLSRELMRLGASVTERPTIRIEPMEPQGRLENEIRCLGRFDWLVLTSVNGVRFFLRAAEDGGVAPGERWPRVAAIGPVTAEALMRAGIPVEVVPSGYRAEELARAIIATCAGKPGRSRPVSSRPMDRLAVLLPRAAEARPILPRMLRDAGAEVTEVTVYRTVAEIRQRDALRELVAAPGLDWITFTSPSTVRCFVEMVGSRTAGARVAAIGPITAETADRLGVPADVVADRHTARGLAVALARAAAAGNRGVPSR